MRSYIYYGYVILVVATIIVSLAGMPAKTIGVSVFIEPVMDALGLSRNQFSIAYMIGTILNALFIVRAGRWFAPTVLDMLPVVRHC